MPRRRTAFAANQLDPYEFEDEQVAVADSKSIPSRFRLRGVLMATFWVAATVAAWRLTIQGVNPTLPLQVVVVLLITLGPCLTVGALYGRTLLAAGIGLAVLLGSVAIVLGIAGLASLLR